MISFQNHPLKLAKRLRKTEMTAGRWTPAPPRRVPVDRQKRAKAVRPTIPPPTTQLLLGLLKSSPPHSAGPLFLPQLLNYY